MTDIISHTTLSPDKDPMGAAIADYHYTGKSGRLKVFSEMFDEDEIPVRHLFRSFKTMSMLEKKAINMAEGKILDVGAGSGCHSLALQDKGKDVHAIDISPLSVDVMRDRGVRNVSLENLFSESFEGRYDTILMLMNGSGIIGKVERIPAFFKRMDQLLAEGGQILMDSSDLIYLYEDEDGSVDIDLNGSYYGEVDYRMEYKSIKGEDFDWLYIDFDTLSMYAQGCGFNAEVIYQGRNYDYLARLWKK